MKLLLLRTRWLRDTVPYFWKCLESRELDRESSAHVSTLGATQDTLCRSQRGQGCVLSWTRARTPDRLSFRAVVLTIPNADTILVPHVVMTTPPIIRLFPLLLYNCKFVTVMNGNVNISYVGYVMPLLWKGWSISGGWGGCDPQVDNPCFRQS